MYCGEPSAARRNEPVRAAGARHTSRKDALGALSGVSEAWQPTADKGLAITIQDVTVERRGQAALARQTESEKLLMGTSRRTLHVLRDSRWASSSWRASPFYRLAQTSQTWEIPRGSIARIASKASVTSIATSRQRKWLGAVSPSRGRLRSSNLRQRKSSAPRRGIHRPHQHRRRPSAARTVRSSRAAARAMRRGRRGGARDAPDGRLRPVS